MLAGMQMICQKDFQYAIYAQFTTVTLYTFISLSLGSGWPFPVLIRLCKLFI